MSDPVGAELKIAKDLLDLNDRKGGDLADDIAEALRDCRRQALAEQENVIKFCMDIAEEELQFAKVGTGAEVALRHISRKCGEAIRSLGEKA